MNLKIGTLLPPVLLNDAEGKPMFAITASLDNTKFNLLLFGYPTFFPHEDLNILQNDYAEQLKNTFITLSNVECYKTYEIKEKIFVLTKPDTTIVLIGQDLKQVIGYMERLAEKKERFLDE